MARFIAMVVFSIVMFVWGALLPGCSVGSQPANTVRVTLFDFGPKEKEAGDNKVVYNPPKQDPYPCSPGHRAEPLIIK